MITKIFGNYSTKEVKRLRPICDKILSFDKEYSALTNQQLQAKTNYFKERLECGESLDDILPEAFAACREASWRVLGLKHYPVQIIGGIVLHQGRVAEMKTGEGKTLVATLPAYLNALSGNGVHIVTVNDYLAKRDSEWMGSIFRFMGLSVGLITHEKEGIERKNAYAADITYGTNNEMGFDYLRDNMVFSKEMRVQRGHNFAIVDEVDSILIDEARTPLIISGIGEKSNELYELANRFAFSLNCIRIKEADSKENLEDIVDEKYDYVVDEKHRTATLTESGIIKAETFFNVENLMDPKNITILHHINQAIKAIGVMRKDVDYIVKDNQVLIVDEFTGRIMPGRRYNEGLHQAIEAKEHIKIERENKTLATITFQNYFRLYKKLSGMTGTGTTESAEFNQIYALDVVQIPTNKPVIRKDLPDIVYKTEKAKYKAIIDQIAECHQKGQPVLIGTASVEKSEYLSKLLTQKRIKHQVLNAKNHEREAEIVAQAGKEYAVTIATNMAGRGTDIKLGGNAEYLARNQLAKLGYSEEIICEATGFAETTNEDILKAREEYKSLENKYNKEIEPEAQRVRENGGLFIIGTERHESRRIDNQLRGRAGRQGDPGTSVFYISLEDDLMRLFGGDKIISIMNSLKTSDDDPIVSKAVSNSIENAQKNIEGKNFGIRKNVLQYDDVINTQRKLIYEQRNTVIDSENIKPIITRMIESYINDNIEFFCSKFVPQKNWNIEGLYDKFKVWFPNNEDDFRANFNKETTRKLLLDKAYQTYEIKEQLLGVDENGVPAMRKIEKTVLLRNVDINWMNHIDAVDQLRKGIGLRAYGNVDPVITYREVTSDMFDAMSEEICENTVTQILTATIKKPKVIKKTQVISVSAANNKPKISSN